MGLLSLYTFVYVYIGLYRFDEVTTMEGDMKGVLVMLVAAGLIVGWFCYCNRPGNGIHGLGKNVALIEGECIVINWDASPQEAELALERWWELRNK